MEISKKLYDAILQGGYELENVAMSFERKGLTIISKDRADQANLVFDFLRQVVIVEEKEREQLRRMVPCLRVSNEETKG